MGARKISVVYQDASGSTAQRCCLNAWLYGLDDAAFTDVTKGNNSYLRTRPMPVMYGPFGFDAAKGWDPVSGRGTPNFDVMLKAALKGP